MAHFHLIQGSYDVFTDASDPSIKEHIMFTNLCKQLHKFFGPSSDRERDAWLAQSSDLSDLERRSRAFDRDGYRSGIYAGVVSRDARL